MKFWWDFIKIITKRASAFSLMFSAGLAAFYLIEPHYRVPETYILKAEIFDIKKEDCSKPNPLMLLIEVDEHQNILLNMQEVGRLKNTAFLAQELSRIFRERETNGVYYSGTQEIIRAVVVHFDKSIRYADIVILIETLNKIGANRIILDVHNNICDCGGCGAGGGGMNL